MDVVGMVGRGVGRVMYSVATPFHPFGGAVDIIVVEQPDGSYRSTPWYVRFGKFQGVLKGAEKVVTITVNGVDASFHMLLDNSGQAYFMRELVPGSEDSGAGPVDAISEPEAPLRSKSDGELYMGSTDLGSSELNEEDQEEQTGDDFDYSKLEEAEDLANQADGGTSEMLLVSVNGCVLTAPISSTEESMEDVQLSSDPQFHLGPGQSSSGDFSRNGEVWEAGILDELYISQEKVKFDSGHQSEALEKLREVSIVKDGSLDISVNESETLHVSVKDGEACVASTHEAEVQVNDGEACVASTHEAEVQVVSQSETNGLNCQLLNVEDDEAHDVSVNNIEGYQPLPDKDEALDVLENNDEAYQPLTSEEEACDVPLVQNGNACKSPSKVITVCDGSDENIEDAVQVVPWSGNNGLNYQLLNVEDVAHDIAEDNDKGYQSLPKKVEVLDVLANSDEADQPLADEDGACDVPLVQNNEDCKYPSKEDMVCDESNGNIEDEIEGVSWSNNNGPNHQSLTVEGEACDVSGNTDEGDQLLPNKNEALDVLENNDESYQPVSNEDDACDIPLVQSDETCNSPAKASKVRDDSNENVNASFSRYDTFKSCLDLTSQDDGDSGTEPFSPEFDHHGNSGLSPSNHSDIDIDLQEGGSETAHSDQSDPSKHLEEVDVSEITSDDNITQSEDLCCEEGSDDRSKDTTTPSKIGTCKSDRLRSSPRISDKDKLGSIPENPTAEEELNKEEHPQLQKGLGFEISLCGHMLRPGMGRTSADEVFQQHLVSEEDLKVSGPAIIKNANLIVKVDGNYFIWSKVSHVVLGKAVFGPDFSVEPVDAIAVERQETPRSGEDSLGMSPSSRRWRLWPIPFRISRSLQRSNSDSSEDIFLDTETVLSPMDEQAPENNKNQSPRKQFVRTLIPTSEQVSSLNLKEGQNIITFSFCTRVFGKQQVEAHMYVWKWNAKIVISDVDGTITRKLFVSYNHKALCFMYTSR